MIVRGHDSAGSPAARRLDRQHVEGAAGEVTGLQRRAQRVHVDEAGAASS